jgi:hypothetical protein
MPAELSPCSMWDWQTWLWRTIINPEESGMGFGKQMNWLEKPTGV